MKRTSHVPLILMLSSLALLPLEDLLESGGFFLIAMCILLGFLIKTMDQLIDDERYKKFRFLIFPFAVTIPLIIGYLAYTHDPVFGMVIGTAVGLIISGKIDHKAYVLSIIAFIVVIVLLVLFADLKIAITSIYIVPFAVVGAYLDEFGIERVRKKGAAKPLKLFFEHRFVLKIAAVICTALRFAQLIHLVAFFCFDIAYDITAGSLRKTDQRKDSIKSQNRDSRIENYGARHENPQNRLE